uniref:WD_REPEATS_REGION domain-containing protein n=1 Tax=Anopheles maculatus TaxID=74869 RepID=A0A182SVY0_9DIPT
MVILALLGAEWSSVLFGRTFQLRTNEGQHVTKLEIEPPRRFTSAKVNNKCPVRILPNSEHIAPALCATLALDNKYIISGSDDSSIIVALFETGKLVTKIDHHRGPVTALHMSYPSEVLVSSSHDATVCLWSLENFTLLNCIQMAQPILNMQISCDSTFLLVHCADNGLYLRSLTTGTELHALKGHKSKVSSLRVALIS